MNKIAYLILSHKDPNNLDKLIKSLDYYADFYVHIDKKSNIKDFLKIKEKYKNIFFIKERVDVSWGDISMVDAMLNLIQSAIDNLKAYQHLVFISGEDYAVKSAKYIFNYFNSFPDKEFIRAFFIKPGVCSHCDNKLIKNWNFKTNIKNIIFRKLYIKFINRVFSKRDVREPFILSKGRRLNVAFGSQWFALTLQCAKEILKYVKENPNYYDYFKGTLAPDEMFFHTIIFNSKFSKNTISGGIEEYSPHWDLFNYHWFVSTQLNCDYISKKNNLFSVLMKNIKKTDQGTLDYLTTENCPDFNHFGVNILFIRKVDSDISHDLMCKFDENKVGLGI